MGMYDDCGTGSCWGVVHFTGLQSADWSTRYIPSSANSRTQMH